MPVSSGREFLSIPGPTVIPDAVLAAMQKPAVDIYAGPLVALTDGLLADMSRIFNTAGRSYIYAANGHGAWEAALTNVLSRGDKVLVLESGRFAIAWGEAAKMLGAQVEVLTGDDRRAVQPEAVEAKLKADTQHQGDSGDAGRHRVGRAERHRGDRQGARRGGQRCAAAGRCGRLARLHAVRDGCLGRRRRDGGLAEGADDAAGLELHGRRAARARGAPKSRTCARPTGTGPSATAICTTTNIAARRRSTCCSACAPRST